jgi:hypothetical protein
MKKKDKNVAIRPTFIIAAQLKYFKVNEISKGNMWHISSAALIQ